MRRAKCGGGESLGVAVDDLPVVLKQLLGTGGEAIAG